MPKTHYIEYFDDGIEMHVFFETVNGVLKRYVVKLLYQQNGDEIELVRFDMAHGCPHKDNLDVDGKVKNKVWFDLLSNEQGLGQAISDLQEYHLFYLARYLQWQSEN